MERKVILQPLSRERWRLTRITAASRNGNNKSFRVGIAGMVKIFFQLFNDSIKHGVIFNNSVGGIRNGYLLA